MGTDLRAAAPWPFDFFWIFFPALWVAVSLAVSALGGWRTLAKVYPQLTPPAGRTFGWRSGRLGSSNYNSCLWFVSGPAGLGLSVLFMFRIGHAPLFIPWTDVSVQLHEAWLGRYADFRFARAPEVRLRVSWTLAERLLDAGGNVVRPSEPHPSPATTTRWSR